MNANWVVLCSMPVVALTLFGLYLAYKTRAVQVEFNEGFYIAIVTYMIALTLLIVGTVVLLLQQPLVQFIIAATLTSLTTLAVQLTFFVPKMQAVFFGKSKSTIETVIVSNVSNSSGNSEGSSGASSAMIRCKYCKQSVVGGGSAVATFGASSTTAPLTLKSFNGANSTQGPSMGSKRPSVAMGSSAMYPPVRVIKTASSPDDLGDTMPK
ncbi:hypothetical protein BCR44DRAFT_1426381 [Catenaria anguillulae PL171]|uniref:G-protein coupled receptors family 3 profile domain-containing protein n=1 Tax=Catenaria anguillulae PL171 TaxID=765915 RepID=A0A1Y2HXJ8_9FUNG|nr:hypothetical protein BCR44DRAFT_1426381 [Catenaria anguillulae PL171]